MLIRMTGGALSPSMWGKGSIWIQWPGTSDPQEYKALVSTGAQCTLMVSSYEEVEPICIFWVTQGSQQITLLEAEVSLTGNEWYKHALVTCAPRIVCPRGGNTGPPFAMDGFSLHSKKVEILNISNTVMTSLNEVVQ